MRKHLAIDLITETYPPEINGVALTVQSLEHGLRELGHRVGIIRPRQKSEGIEDSLGQLVVGSAPIPRYPTLRFGFPSGARLSHRWAQHRPDAVYIATEGPLGWSAMRTAKRLGIPVVSGLHTRFDDYITRYGCAMLAPVALGWMRHFHNQSDITLVPTKMLADELAAHGFTQLEHLSRAVDTRQFHPQWRDEELRSRLGLKQSDIALLHVGRLAAEKNLRLLIDSVRAIEAVHPDAKTVIVGDGPERAALQEQLPQAVFTGMQRGPDLSRQYAIGDVFLFPSLSETFGNVTLEAMASANAVVAFDYGAAREHIVDGINGCAVKPGDHDDFVQTAKQLALSPRRLDIGKAARQSMEKLSPLSVAREFAQLLEEVSRARRIA